VSTLALDTADDHERFEPIHVTYYNNELTISIGKTADSPKYNELI